MYKEIKTPYGALAICSHVKREPCIETTYSGLDLPFSNLEECIQQLIILNDYTSRREYFDQNDFIIEFSDKKSNTTTKYTIYRWKPNLSKSKESAISEIVMQMGMFKFWKPVLSYANHLVE